MIGRLKLVWAVPVFFVSLALAVGTNAFVDRLGSSINAVGAQKDVQFSIKRWADDSDTRHLPSISSAIDGRDPEKIVTGSIIGRAASLDEQSDNARMIALRIGQSLGKIDNLVLAANKANLVTTQRDIRTELELVMERSLKLLRFQDRSELVSQTSSLAKRTSLSSLETESADNRALSKSTDWKAAAEAFAFWMSIVSCIAGVLSAYPAYRMIKRASHAQT